MVSVHYCTFSALSLLPLGRICFCLTPPGFRNPITLGLHVIPVLLVVPAGLRGREEAQHSLCWDVKHLFHLFNIASFPGKTSEPGAPARVTWCQSLGCWQVSWLCWALSNSHLLPGVLRVTGRCFLGTAARSWWSWDWHCGTQRGEAARGEGSLGQLSRPSSGSGWRSAALRGAGERFEAGTRVHLQCGHLSSWPGVLGAGQ